MAENDSGFAIGFFLGAIAGVAIGFLYAPKPGRELRAIIRDRVADMRDRTVEIAQKTREVAEETEKRVRERLS